MPILPGMDANKRYLSILTERLNYVRGLRLILGRRIRENLPDWLTIWGNFRPRSSAGFREARNAWITQQRRGGVLQAESG